MQRFEFKCQNCGEVYESMLEQEGLQKEIQEVEDTVKCQYCKGKLKRVWGVGKVIFNGAGFTKKDA